MTEHARACTLSETKQNKTKKTATIKKKKKNTTKFWRQKQRKLRCETDYLEGA